MASMEELWGRDPSASRQRAVSAPPTQSCRGPRHPSGHLVLRLVGGDPPPGGEGRGRAAPRHGDRGPGGPGR